VKAERVNGTQRRARKYYKFNKETKEAAIERAAYKCECCGLEFNKEDSQKAEVHHLLPIWIILNHYPRMSANLIRSLANAVVLCHDCHCLLHQQEKNLSDNYHEWIKNLRFFRVAFADLEAKELVLNFLRDRIDI